ncbi:hypothetical protein [Streptomyces cyanogenus]|uniref:hypothetical protein n=1 Tax=Streptomyces cyanogenus TaxID=80860 RepID=UPI001AA0FF3F|nr:hypothetical protein [Streptomyces cyanogenus]
MFGENDQRVTYFSAQLKEPAAGLPAFIGGQTEELDGLFVADIGERVREPSVQFEIPFAGRRVSYRPQRQSIELCGRHRGVDGDGMGGQGCEDLYQPLAHRSVYAPSPQVLVPVSLPPWLLVHQRQQDTTQVSAATP